MPPVDPIRSSYSRQSRCPPVPVLALPEEAFIAAVVEPVEVLRPPVLGRLEPLEADAAAEVEVLPSPSVVQHAPRHRSATNAPNAEAFIKIAPRQGTIDGCGTGLNRRSIWHPALASCHLVRGRCRNLVTGFRELTQFSNRGAGAPDRDAGEVQ